MVKNYIKVALRTISRNKVYSFINVFGLALGIASFILIVLWVKDEITFDKYHTNLFRIFRIMEFQHYVDRIGTTQSTPGTLGPHLREHYPEVEYVSRFTWDEETLLETEEQNFYAPCKYVDPDFLRIFTFEFLSGDKETALDDKYSVVISDELARKYFGDRDPVGELIRARNERNLKITGVFKAWPDNSTFGGYEALMSVEEYIERNSWAAQWTNNNLRTVITMHDPDQHEVFESKIKNIVREQVEDYEIDLWLQPLNEAHLYSNYENGQQSGGRITYVKIFSAIAVFILLIACINFMNLATAQAVKRAKEVGLRKVVGAFKKHLVFQFLSESMIFATISGFLALIIVWLLMPYFNEVADKEIVLQLGLFVMTTLIIAVLLTGLFSGSYPAFFIARYKPVQVLKGHVSSGKNAVAFRKALVVIQFFLSIVMIFSTIVVFQQLQHVQSQDTGFDRSGLIYVKMDQDIGAKYEVVKTRLQSDPIIKGVTAMSFRPLSIGNSTWWVDWPGKDPQEKILFTNQSVDESYIATMGLELVVGRSFDTKYPTDTSNFLINEAAALKMGFTPEEALHQNITLWGENKGQIVGVIKDFNYTSAHTEIRPLLLINAPHWLNYMVIRTDGQNISAAIDALEEVSNEFAPAYPFEYDFVDQDWAEFYETESRTGQLFNGFALVSIFIACLGLFGLSAFSVQQRTKEIGVRKVLGASLNSILGLVSKDFLWLILVAAVLGSPVAWYLMSQWLSDFAFRIELTFLIPVLSTLLALLIAGVTVLYHSLKAAKTNPVNALRYE